MNSNTIANTIHSIDIEKYNSIEQDRNNTMGDKDFIQWCKELNIGSRVEVKDYKANELMSQYTKYTHYISKRK